MDQQEFQQKLSELMQEIATLPESEQRKLKHLAQETQDRHQRLRRTVSDLQESVDYLRLSIKYLMFDLEATRRENQFLRNMIDRRDQQDHGQDFGDGGDSDQDTWDETF